MAEFTRKGHWRTLQDGTRTWVSGHSVSRLTHEPSGAEGTSEVQKALLEEKYAKAANEKARRKASKWAGARHNDHLKVIMSKKREKRKKKKGRV